MSLRVPRALLIGAATLAALALAYLGFAWLGVEPLLKWALPRYFAQHGGYQATLGGARFDPFRLKATLHDFALREPDGKPLLAVGTLVVDFDGTSPFQRAWVFDDITVDAPTVTVELRPDGRLNWFDLVDALTDKNAPPPAPDAEPPRVLVRHLALARGVADLTDRLVTGGFHTRAEPLALELNHLSTLPQDRGEHTLSAQTGIGARLRWRGSVGLNPVLATGELAVEQLQLGRIEPYLRQYLQIAPPAGEMALSLSYRASYAGGRFDLALDGVDASLAGLTLADAGAAQPAVQLQTIALKGGRLDLGKREVSVEHVQVGPGRIALQRAADGRLDVQGWLRDAAPAAAAPAAAAPAASAPAAPSGSVVPAGDAATPWQLQIGQLDVDDLALQFTDRGFAAPLTASVDRARLGLQVNAVVGGVQPATLTVQALTVALDGIHVGSEADPKPWFELTSAAIDGGRIALHDRSAGAGTLALKGGRLQVDRDAAGRISVADRLQRVASAAPTRRGDKAPTVSRTTTAAPAANPSAGAAADDWTFKLERLVAQDFKVGLSDASVQPPLALALENLQIEVKGLTQDLGAPVPVALQFTIDRGGRFEAHGNVVPGTPSADLRVQLRDLSLAPAQAFVSQATTLALHGGRASTQGRFRFQPDRWRYDGGLDVRGLQLDESDTKDRFLSWDRLSAPALTLTERGVRVPELRIDGLGAKLVIYKDRTVNVATILKPKPPGPSTRPAPAARAPFQIDVDRVQIAAGNVDFADLSLALPFGTRIHDLKGQLVGVSSHAAAPAQLELDGKVDEFGLARAAGQLRLFDPARYTDLKVDFSNVEMTSLTPYSATFAGRRIDSGKLTLKLEYKIEDRKLAGDNQVLIDKLELGERVDSPSAVNLPLDLAIAILKDADGRIDLGIPVSGSLEDPQFSYGQLIWKAIVNVLTKIVTAPFRALGALLGGGDQPLDTIRFDVGSSELLPPEQEKLAKLAKALSERPALNLTVQPRIDPTGDAQALRERALRLAVAEAAGRQVPAGEDPGPISTAEPATRTALEKLTAQRFGAAELASLQKRFAQANPEPPPAGTGAQMMSRLGSLMKTPPPPLPPEEARRLQGADLHALMLERLLESQKVDEAALQALAQARVGAIRKDLASRGLAVARLQPEPPKSEAGDGKTVPASLGLAAGKGPSAASATARVPVATTPGPGASAPRGAPMQPASAPR